MAAMVATSRVDHDERVDDLALRLTAFDPEAGSALRVIRHFDALTESRAGLQSIVRAAATLVQSPARLNDPARRLTVRVLADGGAAPSADLPDPGWPSAPVTADGAILWLERAGPAGTVEAVVLERAAAAARTVLERTRRSGADPASVELLVDGTAARGDRLAAARRLGLPATVRAVAVTSDVPRLLPFDAPVPTDQRAGVGPAVEVTDLPRSWQAARLALRLTAEGTDADPGPRVVHADEHGALLLLVRAADAALEPPRDVLVLRQAAASAPWVLAALDAVATATSLREAARSLHVHHSTLQDRLTHAEALLGWDLRGRPGLIRLHLALALHRALRGSR
jgi:hypothetical protein